jgi:hypothetical protein
MKGSQRQRDTEENTKLERENKEDKRIRQIKMKRDKTEGKKIDTQKDKNKHTHKEIEMDINKGSDNRPTQLQCLSQLSGGERSMGPTPIAEQWRMLGGPRDRLMKLNYISLQRVHSFVYSMLSQGFYRIINGKRSDPSSQLPINCEARQEIEERAQHLVPPDFHLSLLLPIVFLTKQKFVH